MSSHSRMNEWGSKNIDTFWTSWKMACCPIWYSLTRRNLTLSSASTIKTTVFGVGMHPWRAREWVDTTIQLLLWFGRPSQPLEGLSSFSCPKEWNWTASGTSRTFWKVNCCHGPESTSREHLGPSSKTRRPFMAQEWPNGWFRPTSRRSSARNTGPQGARTWILWTFGVVHPREQGLPNCSWLSRESKGQIAAGMGLDPPRSSVRLVQCLSRETEANY